MGVGKNHVRTVRHLIVPSLPLSYVLVFPLALT